ncbi:MAG: beta-glucosidase [Clostridia bacterium]|nr:beta-glucosidase [Clostridia bacterium]
MGFKKNFAWGAATASYQVEGAAFEDGKGLSIWDVITRKAGFMHKPGQNGDTACDSYHRYKEDVAIMAKLGIKAYRFSISWPRVMPEGKGAVNEKGLQYYVNLVDELLKNGIEPYVTLYHWDMPYEVYKRGGWLNPEIAKWFGEYADVVTRAFGEKVTHYFTINEPQCVIGAGYVNGDHAPALKVSAREALLAIHNTLLAHGEAYRVIKKNVPDAKVGYAPVGGVCHPAEETEACIEAARREMFSVGNEPWWSNTAWSEPIMNGKYPDDMIEKSGDEMPEYTKEEMDLIHTGADFFAFNTYESYPVLSDGRRGKHPDGYARTAMNWAVTEKCLYWGAKFYYERYKLPTIVSENGMSSHDWICRDGKVHDSYRCDYLERHLAALRQAADEGVDIDGYFVWSLLDNFEWREGYNERFGIVFVDFATKERTLKDSAFVYSDIIASNGENL